MSPGSAGKLYTPELLGLATELAHYPLTDELQLLGEARSRTCGSTAKVGLQAGEAGEISKIGLRVSACAVGQASAAIMAREIAGKHLGQVESVRNAIAAWLDGPGDLPSWPGFGALAPARGFIGRHGAILLPWNAALDALSKANTTG